MHARRAAVLLLVTATGFISIAGGCGKRVGARQVDQPNVLIFLIDTLRADHLGCYGYGKNTSPWIDAFARESVLFENCSANAPMTAPSHASMFSSTYPHTHGVWNDFPVRDEETGETAKVHPRLSPNATTLAEALQGAGYETAAIADGGWIIEERGFAAGFDTFESKNEGVVDRMDLALEWLEDTPNDKPFFLFFHTYQVHTPLLPPAGYEDRFAGDYDGPFRGVLADARAYASSPEIKNPLVDIQKKIFKPKLHDASEEDVEFLKALYDAELSLVDEQFFRLMAWMRTNELLENTIVLITSDHGEEFGEHGVHGHDQVYEECLHVPFIVRVPGGPRGLRRADPIEHVDLMPSLLGALGIPVPETAMGRVIDLTGDDVGGEPHALVAENITPKLHQISIRTGDRKTIVHKALSEAPPLAVETFDLSRDPLELLPEAGDSPASRADRTRIGEWEILAIRHRENHGLRPAVTNYDDFSDAVKGELSGLGYVDGEDTGP